MLDLPAAVGDPVKRLDRSPEEGDVLRVELGKGGLDGGGEREDDDTVGSSLGGGGADRGSGSLGGGSGGRRRSGTGEGRRAVDPALKSLEAEKSVDLSCPGGVVGGSFEDAYD